MIFTKGELIILIVLIVEILSIVVTSITLSLKYGKKIRKQQTIIETKEKENCSLHTRLYTVIEHKDATQKALSAKMSELSQVKQELTDCRNTVSELRSELQKTKQQNKRTSKKQDS